ncbi:MAG: T9SS type A sorting domain-containing protein [Ignavibacteriaceae bacterium]|nr:T9SS type A sorting domain-containing protein [Ignavibacteriaceae bacterium]
MKKIFALLLIPYILYGQPEHTGELRIELTNYGTYWDVLIKLSAIGARWDNNYELTTEYELAYVYLTSGHNSPQTIADFDHILDPNAGDNPIFAVGLYKISAIENGNEKFFYMDWRTSHWRYSLDTYFKYDVGNNNFRDWNNTQTINYSYQTLWDLTSNNLITSGLEDYWDNCLVVTNDADNHPRFVFGPYPATLQGTITGYKIYRSAAHIPGQQPSNFTLLVTLDSDEFVYTDNSVTIGNDYNARSYYVTCVYEDLWEIVGETDPTNTVEVRLEIPQKISIPESNHNNKIDYQLEQNYPNPFNPITKISYSLPVSDQVTLKIFDTLGKEVAILLNEHKEAGIYTIEFDASNLASGIYFYRIQIGSYTSIRKLALLK